MPLPNIERTTLLNRANLYFLLGDEELAQPVPPPPSPHSKVSSSSQPSSSFDYIGLHATLQSIQEKQACFWAYIQNEHIVLCGFVQEWYDELDGMIVSQN